MNNWDIYYDLRNRRIMQNDLLPFDNSTQIKSGSIKYSNYGDVFFFMKMIYVGFSEILEEIFNSREILWAVKFIADTRHELSEFLYNSDNEFMQTKSHMLR